MDSLFTQINGVLGQYTANINEALDKAMKTTSSDAVKRLKSTSPSDSGKYIKGWKVKHEKGTYTIYNKDRYQLTHLLENGHDVVVNGKKVGRAPAKPHIKNVEEWVQTEVEKRLEDNLK